MFLEPSEIAQLTGIRGGHRGKTREQRQIAILRAQKVPFYITAAGRPVVARAVIEGGAHQPPKERTAWEPGVMLHG